MRSPVQEHAIDFLRWLTGTKMTALLREKTGWRVAVKEPDHGDGSELKSGYPDTLYDMMNNRSNAMTFRQNSHLLFKSEDGPERFAQIMNEESSAEMIPWLKSQAKDLHQSLRQQETALLARTLFEEAGGGDAGSSRRLTEIFDVNNRREAEYLRIIRFLSKPRP